MTDGHSVAIRWCQLQDQTVCVCILISDDPIVTAHKQSALHWTTRDVSGDIKRRCRLIGDLADPVHYTHGPAQSCAAAVSAFEALASCGRMSNDVFYTTNYSTATDGLRCVLATNAHFMS